MDWNDWPESDRNKWPESSEYAPIAVLGPGDDNDLTSQVPNKKGKRVQITPTWDKCPSVLGKCPSFLGKCPADNFSINFMMHI